MASKEIKGLTVEIAGDTQKLSDALKDVEKNGNNLSKNLTQINNLLKLDPGNTEFLAEKQKILSESIDNTREKLNKLNEAQEQIKQQYADGTIDRGAYLAFQQEVASAQNQLRNFENQLNDMGNSADNTATNMNNVGNAVESAGENAEESRNGWGTLGTTLGTVAVAAGAALAAIGAAAAGVATALADCTIGASHYADDILTLSTQTGIATDKLQGYKYAAELVDVSLESLTGSMAKNIKSMTSAANGSKKMVGAYEKLGISVKNADGSLRDSETVYWEAIDALGKISDETARDSLAMQIFGKSAQDLNPLIAQGSEGMKKLTDEAKSMGAVMGGEALNAFGVLDDNVQRLTAGSEAAKNALGAVLLPTLNELSSEGVALLGEFSKGVIDAGGDIGKIGDVIGKVLGKAIDKISEVLPGLMDTGMQIVSALGNAIITNLPKLITIATQIINQLTQGLIAALPVLVGGATTIITTLANGIGESLPTLIPSIVSVVMQIVQTLVDNIPLLVDGALKLITGLAEGLITAIPVLIQALSQIIDSLINGLLTAIPQIINAGIQLLTALVTAMPDIIQAIVTALPQIIDAIQTALIENMPIIMDAGIQLFTAIVSDLPTIITAVVGALPQIIDSITTTLLSNLPLLLETGVKLLVGLVGGIKDINDGIGEGLLKIWDSIAGFWKNRFDMMKDVGKNMIHGLWEGIDNAGDWLVEKISGFFGGMVDYIKEFFGIHSPSTLFRDQIGIYLAQGVGVGFIDEMVAVAENMKNAIPQDYVIAVKTNIKNEKNTEYDNKLQKELAVTDTDLNAHKITESEYWKQREKILDDFRNEDSQKWWEYKYAVSSYYDNLALKSEQTASKQEKEAKKATEAEEKVAKEHFDNLLKQYDKGQIDRNAFNIRYNALVKTWGNKYLETAKYAQEKVTEIESKEQAERQKSLEAATNKAIAVYQKQVSDIQGKINSFVSSAGIKFKDLYKITTNDVTNVTSADFGPGGASMAINQKTDELKKYSDMLDKLRGRGVGEGIMSQFEGLDVSEGMALATTFSSYSDEQLKKTESSWNAYQEKLKEVAAAPYADELAQAETDLKSTLKTLAENALAEMKNTTAGANEIGKQLIDGMIAGINGESSVLNTAMKTVLQSMLTEVKKEMGIKSPSRVFKEQVGVFLAQGLGMGFSEQMQDVQLQMAAAIPTDFSNEMSNISKQMSAAIPASIDTKINADLQSTANGSAAAGSSSSIVYNQNIYSPKALTPYEIHRNTRAGLQLAAMGVR